MVFKELVIVLLTTLASAASATEQLPAFHIDAQAISVSGVSSGAFMAVQLQVAYSETFSAVAAVAGGPYGCAKADPARAVRVCMQHPEQIDVDESVRYLEGRAAQGLIPSPAGLQGRRAYVFTSPTDAVVRRPAGEKLTAILSRLGLAVLNASATAPMAHGFPTMDFGNPCERGGKPWLLNCGLDLAQIILEFAYGPLNPPAPPVASNLMGFTQDEFAGPEATLLHEGALYAPSRCRQGQLCRLHVALHGCEMNREHIQDQFITKAGFNSWAESNDVIVLYPQVAVVNRQGLRNPGACWDWIGYTGADYDTRKGPQMAAIFRMIKRLQGKN